jgi:pyruvate kinase
MLERLIRAGLDIARLNFSHGDFENHAATIAHIRAAAHKVGRDVTIMADLPGPKIRLGTIEPDSIHLKTGERFILTSDDVVGNRNRVSISLGSLPNVVRPGDQLRLNDGLVHLQVVRVAERDVHCTVLAGGELRSRKGVNVPGVDLGISAFTEHDRACLEFALREGVDAVSQSFVSGPKDIETVRAAAHDFKKPHIFVIAKIERSSALATYDEILNAADGIMIARGDLGVEVPIEDVAIIQKQLILKANIAGKPVITATQMLESMTSSPLPTRAEATDVANAILDGTDCIMLSGESAVGKYPEEAVAMLAKIATAAENPPWPRLRRKLLRMALRKPFSAVQALGAVVEQALETVPCAAIFVPKDDGETARMISRFKPPVWIVAIVKTLGVSRALQFSYGVEPVHLENAPKDLHKFAAMWLVEQQSNGHIVFLVTTPTQRDGDASRAIEFLQVA